MKFIQQQICNFHFQLCRYHEISLKSPMLSKRYINRDIRINNYGLHMQLIKTKFFCIRASEYGMAVVSFVLLCDPFKITNSIECLDIQNGLSHNLLPPNTFVSCSWNIHKKHVFLTKVIFRIGHGLLNKILNMQHKFNNILLQQTENCCRKTHRCNID